MIEVSIVMKGKHDNMEGLHDKRHMKHIQIQSFHLKVVREAHSIYSNDNVLWD